MTMPRYERFEDTPAWQAAAELYNRVLDLLEQHGRLFSPGFRSQLDRCSLSVSNNIAEGFERMTTGGLLTFLDIARGSAGEAESMMRVVIQRPALLPARAQVQAIMGLADSLVRQLTGWMQSVEHGQVQGKRHLDSAGKATRTMQQKAEGLRRQFYQMMKPDHPLYNTPEAKRYREEPNPPQG